MAALSGFYDIPGPPLSGNAAVIAPLHRHGYQNGQQRRYICLLSPPLLFDQNIAKRLCYVPFKLTPSYPSWLSKWPATEVHLFVVTTSFV
jgi:hypothetical protein